MSFSPADSPIYRSLLGDERLTEVFGAEAELQRMVEFEIALARVQGRLGVIPREAAERIEGLLDEPLELDMDALRVGTERDGVPVPTLVSLLRARLTGGGEEDAAGYLHWGATSQDVLDTALVLQLREAFDIVGESLDEAIVALANLADRHRDTLMLGRTHGRHAVPITFGLKAAGWLAPLLRYRERLRELRSRVEVLQLGGAAGTLASLGEQAVAVRGELARELALGLPAMPWHTQRDSLAEAMSWFAGVAGTVAKMAQDVILLGQEEVGEARAGGAGGGSSTMPQKSNPIRCEAIVAAARACFGLLANGYGGLILEHERGTHGWQLEWTALPQLVAYASSALGKGASLARDLQVDEERMRRNLEGARGLVLAESLTFALAQQIGRREASTLVASAVAEVRSGGGDLVSVVRERSGLELDWRRLADPAQAVGAANEFVSAVLAQVQALRSAAQAEGGVR